VTVNVAGIPDYLLAPLAGAPDGAWDAAPPGAWSPGQIVSHIATAIGNSATGLASRADKPAMQRRPRTLAQVVFWQVVLNTGWFGPRRRAPETSLPESHPERAATEAKLRDAVARFTQAADALLPGRARDLFLKHPVLGDLTIEEWQTFHVRHTAHHRRQLIRRLAWLRTT
jgi:uncharacterized protein DUF1569